MNDLISLVLLIVLLPIILLLGVLFSFSIGEIPTWVWVLGSGSYIGYNIYMMRK